MRGSVRTPRRHPRVFATLALLAYAAACGGAGDPAPVVAPPPAQPTVPAVPAVPATAELKELSPFPVGVEAYVDILDAPVPAARVAASFDRYTAAAFYWAGVEPAPGAFDFRTADKAVAFAEAHGMAVHGHPLVYLQAGAAPAWVTAFAGTREAFEAAVRAHVEAVVTRYRGRVASWDVVNEMLGDAPGQPGRAFYNAALERFYTSDAEYARFIALCFRWAHAADPAAKLFYNDALLELPDRKRLAAVVALAAALRADGVPVDGVGTQMHVDIYWPTADIEHALGELAGTGLLVHVSELDVSVNASTATGQTFSYSALTADLAERQRATYRAVVAAYRARVPAAQRWGVTVWDLLDHTSWLNQYRREWPCLYDAAGDKKPAFYGFAEGLAER